MDKVKHITIKEFRLFGIKISEIAETYEECYLEDIQCLNPELFKEVELKHKK